MLSSFDYRGGRFYFLWQMKYSFASIFNIHISSRPIMTSGVLISLCHFLLFVWQHSKYPYLFLYVTSLYLYDAILSILTWFFILLAFISRYIIWITMTAVHVEGKTCRGPFQFKSTGNGFPISVSKTSKQEMISCITSCVYDSYCCQAVSWVDDQCHRSYSNNTMDMQFKKEFPEPLTTKQCYHGRPTEYYAGNY